MGSTIRLLLLPGLTCCLAFGQTASTTPAFEAADVHVSAPGTTESGGFLPTGRLEFQGSTLLRLIATAYSVPAARVSGGPSWIDSDRFDVIAKAPAGTSQIAMRTMLQNLLAERFDLAIQRTDKPQPVYALVPGARKPSKESSGTGDPDCQGGAEENVRTYTCHHVSMANLAERLPLAAPAYFNLPVVDRTGLTGKYDFKLQWLPRAQLQGSGDALHLFNSIEKQLGVKVENQTAPMAVVAIDRVNRTPVPNPPGTVDKLGPAPTEFEVAEIHRSRPDENQDVDVKNGRLEAHALSLKELIEFAYAIEPDWIRGGEKWLETERFTIVAKTAPTASVDTLRTMLQALLTERFRLKVHREQQPVNVYAMTAPKPKLKEADPASRSTCTQAAADGARTLTCRNTTMAQLAVKIRAAAPGYIEHPVVDLTGLKGGYDFALSWAPRARVLGGGERTAPAEAPAAGAVPVATDRAVGLTPFEAVDRQIGLKLTVQKHPMPVVVVDHVDRAPTGN